MSGVEAGNRGPHVFVFALIDARFGGFHALIQAADEHITCRIQQLSRFRLLIQVFAGLNCVHLQSDWL